MTPVIHAKTEIQPFVVGASRELDSRLRGNERFMCSEVVGESKQLDWRYLSAAGAASAGAVSGLRPRTLPTVRLIHCSKSSI